MDGASSVTAKILRTSGRRLKPAKALTLAALGLVLAGLSACSKKELNYQDATVSDLYFLGRDYMQKKQYKLAAQAYDEVERQHPYSVWARRGELMSAYAHYLGNEYDDAILATDRFIQLHPGSPDAAYARYLKAICYYEQITDVGRDQKVTQEALDALNEVVLRHPGTEYAEDAKLKIDLTRDHLAGKEMAVGRYYLKLHKPVAAIGRFRKVVDEYQTTSHVPEALERLTEAYLMLGIIPEATETASVLGHNYPGTEWYKDAYALLKGRGLKPEVSPAEAARREKQFEQEQEHEKLKSPD
jgi:outer membrane protein assembly factor BamD